MCKCPKLAVGLQLYGYSRNTVNHSLINDFHIDPAVVNKSLTEYNLIHWSTNYFVSKSQFGVLYRGDKQYVVVYHKCTRYNVREATEVILSFREAKPEYNLPAYVLVKPNKSFSIVEYKNG